MKKYLPLLFLTIFLSGCYTYRPAWVSFPVSIVSPVEKSITVIEESTNGDFWDKLDAKNDVYEKHILVKALDSLEKISLKIDAPLASGDFNDSSVKLDPKLVSVSVNGNRETGKLSSDGQFYFLFDIKNTRTPTSTYVVDLDYNNLFRTRENISIFWVNAL